MVAQEEYEWGSLPLGGGGFVSAVIAHPTEENLFYARTDVGGIYRWIETTESWKPLTDFISYADKGLYGIEALALDPQKPERLYALAGTSYFSGGKTAILISDDYGETYTVVDVTNQFKAHGNGDGRSAGEKLVVDPNNSDILYCGSRSAGLFKSTNAGLSWSKVSSFPETSTSNGNGISFVLFDESSSVSGNATQTIYVGVSQSNGMYVSKNGGSSWTQIGSQPSTGVPHRAAMKSGTIYVTYAGGAAPNINGSNGAVYKYNGSSWTDITPSTNFNYGGISIVGNRILVSSTNMWYKQNNWDCYGDEVFLSDNLGSSWTSTMFTGSKATLNANGNTWITNHAMHWTGCATLDPHNAQRAFFTSGNGIFYTTNLSTSGLTLKFCYAGLEETVPLDIAQIPSGGLISVIGDYDGATYKANDEGKYVSYPAVHSPEMGTTSGVAISNNENLAVRAGNASPYVQYSTNKGQTWTYCSSSKGAKGNVAVSADGSTILHCPDGSNTTYYSTNKGSSWSSCNGLNISNAYPVADGANAKKFYVAGGTNLYVSTDGGKNFSSAGALASTYEWTTYSKIRTVPGVEGDIWAPCGGNGLYHSINSGTSFSKISSVSSCLAVGLGKAPEGKTYPAVYMWGTVSGTEGLYRSDDAGASWTRINDDLHQFGGPGNGMYVVGDMGAYGNVLMGTVGRGVIYGTPSAAQCAPVDLGDDISICGVENPELNSNSTSKTNVAYTWYKDEELIAGESSPTLAITAGGTYKVVRDSASCSKSDEIVVTALLSSVDLGDDKNLCESLTVEFDAGAYDDGCTFQWQKDGEDIEGATTQTYTADVPATYTCVVRATNCEDVSDDVVLTSSLLNVDVEPACKDGGIAVLTVTDEGGPYEWYSALSGGEVLETGSSYSPEITKNTRFYVQDAGGTVYTIGANSVGSEGWGTTDYSGSVMKLVVTQACTLHSVDIQVEGFWSEENNDNSATVLTIRLLNSAGTEVVQSYSDNLSKTGAQTFTLDFALTPGTYLLDLEGSTANMFFASSDMATASHDGYVTITSNGNWAVQGCFYNYAIKVGSICARTPVDALIDENIECDYGVEQTISLSAGWNLISLYVTPDNTAVESLFASLDYTIVKNNEAFYSKNADDGLQSITEIVPGQGYLIYLNTASVLTVKGDPLTDYTSNLQKGWNIVGVPHQEGKTVASLPASVESVKDLEGAQVDMLESGKAYFILVSEDSTIEW